MTQFGKPHPSAVLASGRSSLLTYEPYYGLREKPFSLSADPRFLYKSPTHAPTFDDLRGGIRRREGLIVLTGDIGTGKTTLCKAVLEDLDRKTFSSFVPDPFLSREDLLKMLLVDFGVVSIDDVKSGRLTGASRPELSYSLYDFLRSLVPLQAFAVIIIDEAQNLPVPLLEEIRILSDLEAPEKLLQVVLVGQLELQAKLKLPEMRQVDQRVSVRCELRPMSRNVVTGYITHRIDVAGGGSDRVEFSSEAIDEIYRVSDGVPRLVNLICDRALHHGYLERSARIQSPHVVRATVDLGLRRRAIEAHVDTKHEWITQSWHAEQPAAGAAPTPDIAPVRDAAAKPIIAPVTVTASASGVRQTPAITPARVITPLPGTAPVSGTAPASTAVSVSATLPASGTKPASAAVPASATMSASRSVPVSAPSTAPATGPGVSELMFTDLVRESDAAPAAEIARDSRDSYVPRRFLLDEEEPVDEPAEEDGSDVPRPRLTRRRGAVVVTVVLAIAAVLAGLSYRQNQSAALAQGIALPPLPPAPAKGVDRSIDALQMHIAASIAMSQNAALYSIDVAGFNSVSRSTDLVEQLTSAGYKAYFEDRQFSQGRMYIVRVGPYILQSEADADAAKIRKLPGYSDARVSVALPPSKQ